MTNNEFEMNFDDETSMNLHCLDKLSMTKEESSVVMKALHECVKRIRLQTDYVMKAPFEGVRIEIPASEDEPKIIMKIIDDMPGVVAFFLLLQSGMLRITWRLSDEKIETVEGKRAGMAYILRNIGRICMDIRLGIIHGQPRDHERMLKYWAENYFIPASTKEGIE